MIMTLSYQEILEATQGPLGRFTTQLTRWKQLGQGIHLFSQPNRHGHGFQGSQHEFTGRHLFQIQHVP